MKAIRLHRYAQASGTELYNDPLGDVIALLPANTWIGVTHESDGWYHVVTSHIDGWIRIEDCTTGMHITLSPTRPADDTRSAMDYSLRA